MERDDARIDIVEQHLEVRCTGLVELIARDENRFADDHNGRDYSTKRDEGDAVALRNRDEIISARSLPSQRSLVIRTAAVLFGSAFMALSAQKSVPLGPVPITGQSLAVRRCSWRRRAAL
ncbi:MAG: hypothetical protein NVS2B17_02730 [Candidatus Velthaea sp.]